MKKINEQIYELEKTFLKNLKCLEQIEYTKSNIRSSEMKEILKEKELFSNETKRKQELRSRLRLSKIYKELVKDSINIKDKNDELKIKIDFLKRELDIMLVETKETPSFDFDETRIVNALNDINKSIKVFKK